MTDEFPSAARVEQETLAAFTDPALAPLIAPDAAGLLRIQADIRARDANFRAKKGVLFHYAATALETGRNFTRVHINQYRDEKNGGRPSLPALAIAFADRLGLDAASAEYRAMILMAVRAERQVAQEPAYHNRHHFADVSALMANLLEKNNEMAAAGTGGVALSKKDQALAFIAAIRHDIGHEGGTNPPHDHYHFEKITVGETTELLKEAGLSAPDIARLDVIHWTTSPNGPHAVLKAVVEAHNRGEDAAKVFDRPADPNNPKGPTLGEKFPELRALGNDRALAQMAAMLSDADLYASAGAGFVSNDLMSEELTQEWRKARVINPKTGLPFDHTTDAARAGFIDYVLGGHFTSDAGRALGDKTVEGIKAETSRRLKEATP